MGRGEEIKRRIFEIIEVSGEGDRVSKAYDTMMLVAVVVGMVPLVFKGENRYTGYIDTLTGCLFLFDYMIRLYTSDYKMGIKSYKAYVAYVFTPMAIIDLLSTIPVLILLFPSLVVGIGMFRVFRILRVLKLIRYSKTMTLVANVIHRVRKELYAVLVLTVTYIAASAMLIFQLEPGLFRNFFDALYWATISITTIGYGDISPVTSAGRMITMASALVGVAVIALPSGIITAAYMDEIKKKKGKFEI
ncbi:voltage-gated potassium channel [Lachnospiraceae bacterium XBB1006]|nr:voltage-gated potassium channel [Lachnospiraceae bacterium XBB1006]